MTDLNKYKRIEKKKKKKELGDFLEICPFLKIDGIDLPHGIGLCRHPKIQKTESYICSGRKPYPMFCPKSHSKKELKATNSFLSDVKMNNPNKRR